MPRLSAAEVERARRQRPGNLDAYDLYLRALPHFREMTRRASDTVLDLIEEALRIDPRYAVAAGLGAWAYTMREAQNWIIDPEVEKKRGLELGHAAINNGEDDSEALAMGGWALAFLGAELGEGLAAIERAISLNPNSAAAYSHAGWVKCYLGLPQDAVEKFERAIRLSPREPTLFLTQAGLSFAHLLLGEFEDAVILGRRALQLNSKFAPTYRALGAALGHLGRLDEAGIVVKRLLELVPHMTVTTFSEQTMFRFSGRLEVILDGLRKAGLPE